jgi:hypothetical protein
MPYGQDYLARLGDAALGAASAVIPKFVSPSDPAVQWTGALRGQPCLKQRVRAAHRDACAPKLQPGSDSAA